MRKMDAHFLLAWEDEANQRFDFFIRLEKTPNEEQVKELTALGLTHIVSQILTAHQLDRDAVEKLQNLDYVKSLSLSRQLYPTG